MKPRLLPGLILAILLFQGFCPLFALPEQKLIYPGHWAYDALTALSLEQRVVLLTGGSITVGQAMGMLDQVEYEALSLPGRELYDRLSGYLAGPPLFSLGMGAFSLGLEPVLEPQGYFSSSQEGPWIYGAHERKPLASLPINVSFSPYISFELEAALLQLFDGVNKGDNYGNFFLNYMDFNIPRKANLTMGVPLREASGIRFTLGMGADFAGRTRLGSVILSDYLEDITYGALEFYAPVFSYSANILQLEMNKYFYFHEVEGRFFKRLSLYMIEGLMVNAPMELRFLNPLGIYHSFAAYSEYGDYNQGTSLDTGDGASPWNDDSRAASFFGARFELEILQYGRIYGLFALNELQTLGEQKDDPDALKPDSLGFQGGTEWFIPASLGDTPGYVSLGLEGIYTYPFLYVLRDKKWSFYKARTGKSGGATSWTGTPFGPDSIAGTVWGGFNAQAWSFEGSFLFAAQGERSGTDIFSREDYHPFRTQNFDETLLSSPTGIPILTFEVSLAASWSPLPWLTLSAYPGYWIRLHENHVQDEINQGFETVLSLRVIPEFLRMTL